MNFLNKVGDFVGKGIDTIKNQINKVQENASQQNTNKLPKGIHILGVIENDNEKSQNINTDDNNNNNFNNKFTNFFGVEPKVNINNNNIIINNDTQNIQNNNQLNQNKSNEKQKSSSSMLDYFQKKSNMQNLNNNNLNQNNLAFPPMNQNKSKSLEPDKDFLKGFELINGEKTINWSRCMIKLEKGPYPCKVLLTEYRLYIIPELDKSYSNYFPKNYFSLLIHKIKKINRIQKPQTFESILEITMNDERNILLIFKEEINYTEDLPQNLSRLLSNLETPLFSQLAFQYHKNNPIYKKPNFEDGWNLYNAEKEYQRMGLTEINYEQDQNKLFRKTALNENYLLCSTYPTFLITVAAINDNDLRESAQFRTKQRLPVLSYYYYNSRGTIWRSSQPKTGISGNKNVFDEELLNKIIEIGNSKKLYIYDCRPYLAAMANKLKGAGYENVETYKNAELFFCEIDNIHSARNSLNKIYNMLKNNNFYMNKKFLSNFEATGWPNFIYGIINVSVNVANAVKNGYSVLIHCSDGWDRASQVTAFSQLLIDPFYRTIKGYMILIEKDFLSYGHQFRYRNGYCSKEEVHENQESPILLQYLDATQQLLVQYPMYFEFNMKFLVFIANNIRSGLFGTFLYNNENEREKEQAKKNTMSIWSVILNNIDEYKNIFYEKKTIEEYFFTPMFPFSRVRLWEEYFLGNLQIDLNISYEEYISKYSGNYFNIFGQVKKNFGEKKVVTNYLFCEKEKEEYIKNNNKQEKEIENLKKIIKCLCIDNNVDKNVFETIPKECDNILKNIAKENGGKITLNEEENKYIFRKTKNMFEGIVKNKIKKEEIKEESDKKDEEKNNNNIINNEVLKNEEKKEEPNNEPVKNEEKNEGKGEGKGEEKEDIEEEILDN